MESSPETCLVCLKNNHEDRNLILFDLSTEKWENVTYLNKLLYVVNADIVIYESTLICSDCLNDLNKAYEFREKVIGALDYWCMRYEDSVTIANKSSEQVEDRCNPENNEIVEREINTYDEDVISIDDTEDINPEIIEINEYDETGHTSIKDYEDAYSYCANFPCGKCDKIFPTASLLIRHSCNTLPPDTDKNRIKIKLKPRKYMEKQKTNTFECKQCNLSFTKRCMLSNHLKTHTDNKYMCTFCNRTFKQSYPLWDHIASHTGERNYRCDMCGKSFQHLSSQRRHINTCAAPAGQKAKKSPFLCTICGKSFPYSNSKQRHMRTHTGDKKYECKICSKKFNQSTHLTVHLRTHTGEKPYMCSFCGESFSLKASLHKHTKSLHMPAKSHEAKNSVKPKKSRAQFQLD